MKWPAVASEHNNDSAILTTNLNLDDETGRANAVHHRALRDTLWIKVAVTALGGS
jgi:hypothetical protein